MEPIDQTALSDAQQLPTPQSDGPLKTLLGFLWRGLQAFFAAALLAFVGAFLTAYFQGRAANSDKVVEKRQTDSQRLFDVEQKLSSFIDQRWAAADAVTRAFGSGEEEKRRALENYASNFEQWQSQFAGWAGLVAFYADAPFQSDHADSRPTAIAFDDRRSSIDHRDNIECLSYTLYKTFNLDLRSASHILQVIDHCHNLSKGDLDKIAAGNERAKSGAAYKNDKHALSETEQAMNQFRTRISHIWWLNNVLRCMILQRADAVRGQDPNSTWQDFVWPSLPDKYDITSTLAATDCKKDLSWCTRRRNNRPMSAALAVGLPRALVRSAQAL